MKQCCIVLPTRCEKPAVCTIEWPDADTVRIEWYCAEHYDQKIARLKASGRIELLKGTGVR